MNATTAELDARAWWSKRRLAYNLVLVGAGVAAFLLYCLEFECLPHDSEAEITVFTTAFQGLGYLVFLGVANLAYGLGVLSETVVKPLDAPKFRKTMFWIGMAVSVAAPLMLPVLVGVAGLQHHP